MEPADVVLVSATLTCGKEAWQGAGMFPAPKDSAGWQGLQGMIHTELESMVRTLVQFGSNYRLTLEGDYATFKGAEAEAFRSRWHAFVHEGGLVFSWVPIKLSKSYKRKG